MMTAGISELLRNDEESEQELILGY